MKTAESWWISHLPETEGTSPTLFLYMIWHWSLRRISSESEVHTEGIILASWMREECRKRKSCHIEISRYFLLLQIFWYVVHQCCWQRPRRMTSDIQRSWIFLHSCGLPSMNDFLWAARCAHFSLIKLSCLVWVDQRRSDSEMMSFALVVYTCSACLRATQ